MYSMSAGTNLATQIAKQRVDEWIRDAEVRRTHRRRNLIGYWWERLSRWAPVPGR
jgi:hypothetical protein